MTEFDVTQADVVERLDFVFDFGYVGKKIGGFLYRHIQHFADVFAFVAHFESFAIIPCALADFTRHINIRQKVHFDFDDAVALTMFASSAVDVEGKSACRVTSCFCGGKRRKQLSYISEHARVGCGIRTRSFADGALVYADNFVKIFDAFYRVVVALTDIRAHERV